MADHCAGVVNRRALVTVGGGALVSAFGANQPQARIAPDRAAIEAALVEMQDLASDAPGASSILNKLNKDGSNVDDAEAFRTAIGADLAGNVNTTSGVMGGTARTLEARGHDALYVRDLGLAADGSINDTTALSAAISNAAGRTIRIPRGQTVKVAGTLTNTYAGDVTLIGEPGSVLDFSGGNGGIIGAVDAALPNLAADIVRGSSTVVTFTSAHGLAQGDVFKVCNAANFSGSSYRDYYRAGRMFRVATVLSSTQVRIFGTSPYTFASAGVTCWKLTGGTLTIENLSILPRNNGTTLEFQGFTKVRIKGLNALLGSNESNVVLFNCYDVQIDDPQGYVDQGDAYPITILNSQKGVLSNITGIYSARHPISFGGRDVANTVPCSDFAISGFQADTISANGIGAIDSHPNCDNIMWANGTTEGATLSGSNATLRNATVRGRAIAHNADGLCIDAEMNQGTMTIENVRFETFGNTSNAGLIRVDLRERNGPCTLVLRNVTCVNPNAMTRGLHLLIGSRPLVHTITVIIDGWIQAGGGSLAYLLSLDGSNDVSAITSGMVRNLNGTINGLIVAGLVNENYGVPIHWPSTPEGVTDRGDADVVLNPRTTTRTQYFNAALTANRTVTFTDSGAASGDKFEIVRVGGSTGGPWALTVLGVALKVNEHCTVEYRGRAAGAGGAFVMTAKGPRV